MSNPSPALSRIDSRAIGEAEAIETPEVIEADAVIASEEAGLSAAVIQSVAARTKVGRFAAAGMSGYIVGDTIRDNTIVEKALLRLEKELDAEKIESDRLIAVCDSISKLVNSRTGNRAVLLKAVEISANRRTKKNNQANAPQRINAQVNFTGPTQINASPSTVGPDKPLA